MNASGQMKGFVCNPYLRTAGKAFVQNGEFIEISEPRIHINRRFIVRKRYLRKPGDSKQPVVS